VGEAVDGDGGASGAVKERGRFRICREGDPKGFRLMTGFGPRMIDCRRTSHGSAKRRKTPVFMADGSNVL